MMHTFAHPLLMYSLAALPVLTLLSLWARWRRRKALARFGLAGLEGLRPAGWGSTILAGFRSTCMMFGLTALAIGMAGPRWGRDWGQSAAPGRDLIVVVDCSQSMRAEAPSRLERARTALLGLTATLRQRGGHRVGLVLFAGKARLVCPLTHDFDHFRESVESIDLNTAGVDLQGEGVPSDTRIGQALVLAVLAHDDRSQGARDILLLSDGDDPAGDAEWGKGIARAKGAGIPVHCVGFGDPDKGHRIPIAGGYLFNAGEPVYTRLKEAPLREIATQTGGVLALPGTARLALGEHYLALIESRPLREDSPDALPVLRARYHYFLLPALGLLSLALLLPERRRPAPAFGAFAYLRSY
jgi:Ca-activated chloride channel family protein